MLGPAAFVFLLGHRWTYITSAGAFWSTLIGAVAMLVYEILKLTGVPVGSVHTVIIGTVITLPTVLGVSFFTQPKPAKPDSTLAGDQSDSVALSPDQQRLLRLIRTGYTTMVELSDFMALTAVGCHRLITELERIGLIQRWGSRGLDFFTFALTPKGDVHLSQLPDSPAGFVTQDADSRTVLEQLKHEAKNIQTLSTATGMAPSMLSVVVNRLDQLGYVSGSGIWQRTIALSEKGRALVSP
jgi:DNA-binding MarR family transcriptional regulator